MAYTDNHCDLNRIKDKPIAGFTIRQILSFAAIVVIGVPTYTIMYANRINTTIACLVLCGIAVPIFFIGTYEDVNGRPVEKIIYAKIRLLFLTKSKRPYATNNSFSALKRQRELEEEYKSLLYKSKTQANKANNTKKQKAVKTVKAKEKKKQKVS